MSFQNIVDFSFRALTLGGRFVLLIAIAKYLSPDDVGIYGILCSLISYVLYFLGIDFYVYSTRKIICGGVNKIWGMLYNQYVFYLFGYVLLIIVSQQVFTYSGISDYAVMGVAIALFEHMSQEMYRVLIVIKKIRAANIQLFIRSGSWCYITSLLLCIKNITDLKSVMFIWMLFSFISVCYALFVIYVEVHPKREDFILDLSWIIEGVKVSSFFFIGTICLRGIFYFDKI
ncbi:O165 family O-antigen flippase, partial [Escherichia coli]|nr:O165 family O-antigen flippase [Escherichia coli]